MSETLVLNKLWQRVNVCSSQKALRMAYKDRVKIMDTDPWDSSSGRVQWSLYDLFDWIDRGIFEDKPAIQLNGFKIQVPEIVVCQSFSKPPLQVVKYCRRNLWIRDNYACQYCGKKPSKDDISVDHILPKSRGGISSFENTVLACTSCNKKKDNKTPEEAGMRLRRYKKNSQGVLEPHYYDRPKRPPWDPCFVVKRSREDYPDSWSKFVSEMYWEVTLEP